MLKYKENDKLIMAHYNLLFVGKISDLQKIFDDVPDSFSESAAEITIGADYIDWEDDFWGSGEFTKFTKETKGACHLNYNDVIEGHWYECYDVRDPNRYGSFDCLNCPDYEPYEEGTKREEREKRNKARAIEAIKKLPDDTVFFFADSHW